jgi:hypothetical protein
VSGHPDQRFINRLLRSEFRDFLKTTTYESIADVLKEVVADLREAEVWNLDIRQGRFCKALQLTNGFALADLMQRIRFPVLFSVFDVVLVDCLCSTCPCSWCTT